MTVSSESLLSGGIGRVESCGDEHSEALGHEGDVGDVLGPTDNENEKKCVSKLYTIPGRMLLVRREKSK